MKVAACFVTILLACTVPGILARSMTTAGYNLIKGFEGFRDTAYQ